MLVNAARGGIVDEQALYDALKTGRIAAAGLDVFAKEPCTDSPLFELENVVATPHLGASTDEAQEKAGLAVARSVRLALAGELVPDAVNVQGGVIAEEVRPGIPLTERLGRVFTSLAGEVAQQIDVEVRGEITEFDVKVLELAALKGVFHDIVEEQVSYVNAPLLAAERGTAVRLVTDPESPDHRNLITIRGTLADGSQVSVSGTLVGLAQKERLVEVNGFDVDIEPTDHLAFFTYEDRPGIVGIVGRILGEAAREHRRHAGLARHQGRSRAGGPVGRLRDPGRRARRDRRRHRRGLGARREPRLSLDPRGDLDPKGALGRDAALLPGASSRGWRQRFDPRGSAVLRTGHESITMMPDRPVGYTAVGRLGRRMPDGGKAGPPGSQSPGIQSACRPSGPTRRDPSSGQGDKEPM